MEMRFKVTRTSPPGFMADFKSEGFVTEDGFAHYELCQIFECEPSQVDRLIEEGHLIPDPRCADRMLWVPAVQAVKFAIEKTVRPAKFLNEMRNYIHHDDKLIPEALDRVEKMQRDKVPFGTMFPPRTQDGNRHDGRLGY